MSELDSQYVKRGAWTNLAEGPVMGRTITTDTRTGTVVVALLAVLSALAASHLWSIVVFTSHQIRAHGRPADGLFRQQQALLRTNPPPSALLADWIKLWWVWRKRTSRASWRSTPLLVLAAFFATATIAVSIFSSYIVRSANTIVLVKSDGCAPLDIYEPFVGDYLEHIEGITNYRNNLYGRSRLFAQDCYINSTSLPARCGIYIRPNIPIEPTLVDCTFDKSICKQYEKGGASVDSGLIDVNGIFGWNLKPSDRIRYRRKSVCSIIKSEGHSSTIDASSFDYGSRDWLPGEQLLLTHYGESRFSTVWTNTTFIYSFLAGNISSSFGSGTAQLFRTPQLDGWNDISTTLPSLNVENADLALVQVKPNKFLFGNPVDDPLFAAHVPFLRRGYDDPNLTHYLSDNAVSTLGCNQQYQYCYLRNGKDEYCTELGPVPGNASSIQFPGASDIQRASMQLLITGALLTESVVAASQAFEIKEKSRSGYIASLPNDQWIREITTWERFIWASLQTFIADYSIGYHHLEPTAKAHMRTNMTDAEKSLCGMQRMKKAGGFMNINVFGLTFIIVFSCVITLVDLLLLKFLIFLSRFRRAVAFRIDLWIQDGVFQLQRKAYEGHNQESWQMVDKEIPVPVKNDKLENLPLQIDPVRYRRVVRAQTDRTVVEDDTESEKGDKMRTLSNDS
ncbi:hypothetical protein BU24DRAFT_390046 [Aaosphaeria arxii CBS 175.79]|uniref:Uncharacterized protein n=1 Tax=Aaosphaeria arxii CBS 175.79 TaxID=1450172 RepID=A0A6A5XY82_9PLEO|nr:uncharacterized protein BU24DRAFT_390046 [Aaosphaeria arxii CBS 175.79]KAF2018268.1 hypothetical protein BU24DRAFT_390046 [Aaosphaeria arxii CBS 175.79]